MDRRRRDATSTQAYDPTLTLVYLPHLDYVLQRVGPDLATSAAKDLRELDAVCGHADRPLRAAQGAR